MLHRKTP